MQVVKRGASLNKWICAVENTAAGLRKEDYFRSEAGRQAFHPFSINIFTLAQVPAAALFPFFSVSLSIPGMADMAIIAGCQARQACGNIWVCGSYHFVNFSFA